MKNYSMIELCLCGSVAALGRAPRLHPHVLWHNVRDGISDDTELRAVERSIFEDSPPARGGI